MKMYYLRAVPFALVACGCTALPKTSARTTQRSPLTTICINDIQIFGDEEFRGSPPDHPAIHEVQRVIRTLAEGAFRRQGFVVVPCNEPCKKLRVVIAISVIIRFSTAVSVKSAAFSDEELLFELYSSARSQTYAKKDIVETQERLTDELARAFRKRVLYSAIPLALGTPTH